MNDTIVLKICSKTMLLGRKCWLIIINIFLYLPGTNAERQHHTRGTKIVETAIWDSDRIAEYSARCQSVVVCFQQQQHMSFEIYDNGHVRPFVQVTVFYKKRGIGISPLLSFTGWTVSTAYLSLRQRTISKQTRGPNTILDTFLSGAKRKTNKDRRTTALNRSSREIDKERDHCVQRMWKSE